MILEQSLEWLHCAIKTRGYLTYLLNPLITMSLFYDDCLIWTIVSVFCKKILVSC